MYVVLDEQSNKSLAKTEFFNLFNINDNSAPYIMKTCSGVTETSGRRAVNFMVESIDGHKKLTLPTLIECDMMPDDRMEIPSPDIAHHHPHLQPVADKIPAVDPDAPILLLLGRDILTSAHAGLLSDRDGEQGQGQGAEDQEDPEHGKAGGPPPQPEGQEEEGSDLIIQPKKLLNPVRVSKSHQELHRELRMTHKRGPCLEGKPELQHVLEQRNWEQGVKQRREAEEEKKNRSPLQQELLKRHQRLEELERELKAQQQGLQSSPEFIRVKESLRCTTILDVGKAV
ncbi:uncharacterized protein LOC121578462 [Coregonus clupeaformis]|uniref:uncharacterized protein LOC121578462 n=1 Tax=Coregonus clupeaformis TaxID=59861 RepID=UPI001E1C9258|nr:uncharacterized protein LOC121578462 [Coregonus clupeaformis]